MLTLILFLTYKLANQMQQLLSILIALVKYGKVNNY